MPRTRKDEAPIGISEPVIEGRYVELDDYTVSFETFPVASDPGPLFAGLPDDRCQCPHWGYVVRGSFSAAYADGEGPLMNLRASGDGQSGTETTIFPPAVPASIVLCAVMMSSKSKTRTGFAWRRPASALATMSANGTAASG